MVRVAILATIAVVYTLAGAESYAQTLNVIRAFSGPDGAFPYSGLTSDGRGNLYGTTSAGGNTGCSSNLGCGTVFSCPVPEQGGALPRSINFKGTQMAGSPWRESSSDPTAISTAPPRTAEMKARAHTATARFSS